MDFIKKTICLEEARTRTQGLMPYYAFGGEPILTMAIGENGNWGQFVANPCFLAENNKTYEAMLRKYYKLLNMVREGVKLRKVETKEGEIIFTEDLGAFEWVKSCPEGGGPAFNGGTEPDLLYEYAAYDAKDFYSTEIESLRDETKHIYRSNIEVGSGDTFIVLIKDFANFQKLTNYLNNVSVPPEVTTHSIGNNPHTKWADYCQVVDDCIGKINIPARVYNKHIKVPKSMPCADVQPYIDWLTNYQSLSADCCNARLYEDMGGADMLEILEQHTGECQTKLNVLNGLEYAVPYIEMPILLTQNFTDVGVLTNIDGVLYDKKLPGPVPGDGKVDTRPHGEMSSNANREEQGLTPHDIELFEKGGVGLTIGQIIMGTCAHTAGDIEVESLLQTLRNKKKYTDDKDNVLPGDFLKFDDPAGKMFACVKYADESFYDLKVESYTIGEGEQEETLWRIVYEKNSSLTRDSVHGLNNFQSTTPGLYNDGYATEALANADVLKEQQKYDQETKDTRVALNRYIIGVADPTWTMYELSDKPKDCLNADGKESSAVKYKPSDDFRTAAGKNFRTITTCAAGIRIAETEEDEMSAADGHHSDKDEFKTHYFFFVKYDNSPYAERNSARPMIYPYKVGNTANVYLVSSGSEGSEEYIYRGDFISSLTAIGRTFKVEYVIGGYFKGDKYGNYDSQIYPESGDVYYEEYDLDKEHIDYVALDGVDNVPVWSQYIDFEGAAKEFYSTRYGLTRTGNTAKIVRFNSGEVWDSKSTALSAYDAYLTKEEYLTNFSLPPKVDVNVTVDRGGVSAFEKHYKLAECNTMQDLVNYGNNYFNL